MSYNTQKKIDQVCEYRGLPPVKKGSACTVSGRPGKIHGGNSSAKLNVIFDDSDGRVSSCHPYWKMRIFNDDGSILYESDPPKPDSQRAGGGV